LFFILTFSSKNGKQRGTKQNFPPGDYVEHIFLGAGKTKFLKNVADVGVKWVEKKQDRETI